LIQFFYNPELKKKRLFREIDGALQAFVNQQSESIYDTRLATFPVKREHYSKNAIKLAFSLKIHAVFTVLR
jgi:hypothetical protein